jgi:hypothetical protein
MISGDKLPLRNCELADTIYDFDDRTSLLEYIETRCFYFCQQICVKIQPSHTSMILIHFSACSIFSLLTLQRSWLRHSISRWEVAGSITDEVANFLNSHNPSSLTMSLVCTGNIPGVKRGWRLRLATSVFVSQLSRKCGNHDVSQTYGTPRPDTGIDLLFLLYKLVIFFLKSLLTG